MSIELRDGSGLAVLGVVVLVVFGLGIAVGVLVTSEVADECAFKLRVCDLEVGAAEHDAELEALKQSVEERWDVSATRKQCEKCPWRVDVDPNEIPNGYCSTKHEALLSAIAEPGSLADVRGLRVMACHETPVGGELACVGWLVHQLGVGNSLGLRLAAISGWLDANVETVGEQHPNLGATLPASRKRRST